MKFDEFIAIDWSGAKGPYAGIAVGLCHAGDDAPILVEPRTRRWTRTEIAEWLTAKLQTRTRCLIGLDFAFGFPFEEHCGYLGGTTGIDDIFGLWSMISARSLTDTDFGCTSFINHSDFAPLFWTRSTRPQGWMNRKRRTEVACAKATGTHPDTVYKMIGPKQVGKASITGIRVLHHVRSRHDSAAIWPFEPVRASALVEIYPTLFRKRATNRTEKIREWKELNRALEHFRSRPLGQLPRRSPTDHETDALLSAAGLRASVRRPEVWQPPEIASPRVRREGWIFGLDSASLFSCPPAPKVAS
jgi:hypothetical protein